MSITSDNALPGTCCVCGKPISSLIGALPPLPGAKNAKCSKCGREACSEHIKQHQKSCGTLDKGNTEWCKVPPLFP